MALPSYERTLHLDRRHFIPAHNRGIPISEQPKTLGQHLRRRRAELKLYQRQAIDILHVSMVTLSKWERDHTYPTWDYHARIIEYLRYDVFKMTGPRDPYSNEPSGVAFFAAGAQKKIGHRIRRKRLERKLTATNCAQLLGVAVRTLRDWEAGTHQPLKRYAECIKKFLADT